MISDNLSAMHSTAHRVRTSWGTLRTRSRQTLIRWREAWTLQEGPHGGLIALAAVAVLFSWNLPTTDPNSLGGDRDFWYQMVLASDRGVDFGTALATSYGPLYFLTAPSITHPLDVAVAFALWSGFAIACMVALAQTRRSKLGLALIAVLAISAAATPASVVITSTPVLLFCLSLSESLGTLPRWMHRAFPFFSAAFIALLSLNKFSTAGITAAAVVAALLIRQGRERWITFAQFAATGGGLALGLWLLKGQPLLSFPEYVYRSLTVGSGYGGALGIELGDNLWEYIFAGLGVIAIVAVLVKYRPRVGPLTSAIWVILMLVPAWLMLKQGFMRHDSHSAQFFALIACALAVMAYQFGSRLIAALTITFLVTQVAIYGQSFASVDPAPRVAQFGRSLATSFIPSARDARLKEAKAAIRKEARLPDSMVKRVGSSPVYLEPFNGSVPFAYGLNSAIIPTILEYGAYNPELDGVNSRWFADDQTAPAFILRRVSTYTVDKRNPLWDSPDAKLEEICRYGVVESTDGWILLQRRPQSACGPLSQVRSARVAAGESLTVEPQKDALTVVQIHPSVGLAAQLRATLFKPSPLKVRRDDTTYRLPWGDVDAPIVVAGYDYNRGRVVGVPSTIEVSVDADVTIARVPITSPLGS